MPSTPRDPSPISSPAVTIAAALTSSTTDPLELLARDDKWQLGAGDGVLHAPTFPLWLDRPGFWDEAHIHHWAMAPLFTITVLDDQGRELALQPSGRRWTPAELIVEYRLGNGMHATEVRTVHPGGIFVSEWRLRGFKRARLHFIMWTRQPLAAIESRSVRYAGALSFVRRVRDDRGAALELQVELGCSGGVASWLATGGEETGPHPDWRLTPFVEQWRSDGLSRTVRDLDGKPLLFGAVHRELTLDGESGGAVFAMRIAPADPALRGGEPPAFAHHAFTLGGVSRRRWRDRFDMVPSFRCSDPYLEMAWWYRWYAIFLNAVSPAAGRIAAPAVTAGIGHLHELGARATAGVVRDLRWLPDPELARGALRAVLANAMPDGSLPSAVRASGVDAGWDPDVSWGDALSAIHECRPDAAFLGEAYDALAAHARWLAKARDPNATGIIGVDWSALRPLDAPTAVAATTAAYQLFRTLERGAHELRHDTEAPLWTALAGRCAAALRSRLWDAEEGSFRDPAAPVKVLRATDFAPYATDVADERHAPGMRRYLMDPDCFWTAFPVPVYVAPAADGREPLRGRVDPAVDALLIDAMARAGRYTAPLRDAAAQLLRRFIHMRFHDGDLRRPNACEDYNPLTGHGAVYRGLDDGTAGWTADLLVRHAAGVRIEGRAIWIDPLPLGLDFMEIGPLIVQDREIHVRIDGGKVVARLDGEEHRGRIGTPMQIAG